MCICSYTHCILQITLLITNGTFFWMKCIDYNVKAHTSVAFRDLLQPVIWLLPDKIQTEITCLMACTP